MQNQNKYILFSEYLTLKNAYIILGNNYDKIKEENKNLKKILNEFQTSIAYFEETKNNIYLLSEEIKNKFNKKYFNIIEFNKNFNFQILGSNSYENLLKNFKDLEEKYKTLKEEQNKNILNKLGTNTYSTNTFSNKNDKNYININNNISNSNNNNFKNNCYNNIIESFVNNFEKNEFEPVPTFLKCLNKIK